MSAGVDDEFECLTLGLQQQTGSRSLKLSADENSVIAVACSSNGRWFACARVDGRLELSEYTDDTKQRVPHWSVHAHRGRHLMETDAPTQFVSLDFTESRRHGWLLLSTSSEDDTVRVWSVQTGVLLSAYGAFDRIVANGVNATGARNLDAVDKWCLSS